MIILILIIFGLCFGSFINAFVYRLYEKDKYTYGIGIKKTKRSNKSAVNLSIWNGRSVCVNCKHVLAWYDLIPVISWLSLQGKCRYCKKLISWQYPLVELSTMLLFVFSYFYWPLQLANAYDWINFGFWLVYIVGFVSLIIFDIKWMILPNKIVYSLLGIYGLQLVYMLLMGSLDVGGLISVLLGALTISGFFWLIFQVSGGKWIGGGDVKLGLLLGALAGGVLEAFLVIFLASLLGSVIGGGQLLLARKFNWKTQLPFGPYLMVATFVVVLFGASILGWYKELVYL